MKYRRLGSTHLKVSVIGIGTWQFGGEWGKQFSESEVASILGQAKEVGINFIDTAECYGDHKAEALIGAYMKSQSREDWVIATKFGHQFHQNFERTNHWSSDEVIRQLEASLRALQTDYVDLYQFHSGQNKYFDNDELWTALDKQVEAGKIRNLGLSIGKSTNLHQTEAASDRNIKAIQLVYNRLDRKPEQDVLSSCTEQGLGVIAREPLASGFLTGKYKQGAEFKDDDIRHRTEREVRDAKIREVERLKEHEMPAHMDISQWALAWCLKHPAITCVIPGCKSPEQVRHNAAAAQYVNEDHPQAWSEED